MSGTERNRALGFAINDSARAIRQRFNEESRPLGLTQAQCRILIYVNRQPGVSQKALADLLEVRPMSLTRQLDRLQQAGLLERRANLRDRRAFQLFVTAAAEPLLQQIRRIGAQVMCKALAGFSEDETAALLAALQRLKANLGLDGPA